MADPRASSGAVSLFTGGIDPPYVFGLAMEMIAQGIFVDLIGSDALDRPEMHSTFGLNFLNLQGSDPRAGLLAKVWRMLTYYTKVLRYAATAEPRIFHILWNNKLVYFDRTFLMLYYKLLGKKIVFTAHNVNAGKRDGNDSLLNRVTLKIQYHLADHIFVHTERMKKELLEEFAVPDRAVTVIPFGINNSAPNTDLSPAEARRRLGIAEGEKTILFFGRIRPYKGLDYLVDAFHRIAASGENYRLIIAGEPKGEPKKETQQYWAGIQENIARGPGGNRITQCIEFVSDAETELYFKAADVSVLPYTMVFQSGVLFLSYSFGLPVIATDVGSLREDIIEGKTGFTCKACDAEDLARAIETYFASDLFKDLSRRRLEIREYANAHHSWTVVGTLTRGVYDGLVGKPVVS
jgi:D-inositol-3-phosphate glycosyltransferase